MSNRALARYGGDCGHNDRQITSRNRQPSLSLARWGGGGRDAHHSSSYRGEARASRPLFSRSSRHTSTRARYDNSSGDEYSRPRRARIRRSTREAAYSSEEDCSPPGRGIRATLRDAFSGRGERDPCDDIRVPGAGGARRQPRAHGEQLLYCEDGIRGRRTSSPDTMPRASRPSRAATSSCEDEDFDSDPDAYLSSPGGATATTTTRHSYAEPPRVNTNSTPSNTSRYPSSNVHDPPYLRTPTPAPQQSINHETTRARSHAPAQPSLNLGDRAHLLLEGARDRDQIPRRWEGRRETQRDEEAEMAFLGARRGRYRDGW